MYSVHRYLLTEECTVRPVCAFINRRLPNFARTRRRYMHACLASCLSCLMLSFDAL